MDAPLKKRPFRPRLEPDSPRGRAVAVLLRRCPSTQIATFKRAFQGRSVAAAVKAKCLECSCFNRADVRDCPVVACPLWAVRPFQVDPGCPAAAPTAAAS